MAVSGGASGPYASGSLATQDVIEGLNEGKVRKPSASCMPSTEHTQRCVCNRTEAHRFSSLWGYSTVGNLALTLFYYS